MHWLAEHIPKSANYQYTKLCHLGKGVIREGAKNYFKVPLSDLKASFNKKPKSTFKQKKSVQDFSSMIQIPLFGSARSKLRLDSTFKASSADQYSTSKRF